MILIRTICKMIKFHNITVQISQQIINKSSVEKYLMFSIQYFSYFVNAYTMLVYIYISNIHIYI